MIPISEILTPVHVNLALAATDQVGGVDEVLSKLNGDPRILDWDALKQSITERNAPAISCGACGICIAHGRTNAVQSLVMAAGRSTAGLTSSHVKEPVRLVFVAGIPAAFHSEYLRIVGAIARLCSDKALLGKLLSTQDPEKFVGLLSSGETKL
ncbi:MAG: PTS sugar transporter subunit IIA [Verrucomicrobia bacterium]|nr:PTS sugar transporter subunit IIA [Verrucomicrobiota bacterium]